MSPDDTQPLDPRELQDDPETKAPTPAPAPAPVPATTPAPGVPNKGFDWSWFKSTGLEAVQHAAVTFLSVTGGDALDLWHMDYKALLGTAGGAAVVSVLRAIVAYKLPSKSAT